MLNGQERQAKRNRASFLLQNTIEHSEWFSCYLSYPISLPGQYMFKLRSLQQTPSLFLFNGTDSTSTAQHTPLILFLHSILPTFCDLWAKIEPGTLLFFATKRKGLRAESIRHFEFQTSGLCAKKEPQLTAAARIKDRIRAYLQNGESERRFAITFGISSNT
jgi:hypothetical protein